MKKFSQLFFSLTAANPFALEICSFFAHLLLSLGKEEGFEFKMQQNSLKLFHKPWLHAIFPLNNHLAGHQKLIDNRK